MAVPMDEAGISKTNVYEERTATIPKAKPS
jgi:hypothetical protein